MSRRWRVRRSRHTPLQLPPAHPSRGRCELARWRVAPTFIFLRSCHLCNSKDFIGNSALARSWGGAAPHLLKNSPTRYTSLDVHISQCGCLRAVAPLRSHGRSACASRCARYIEHRGCTSRFGSVAECIVGVSSSSAAHLPGGAVLDRTMQDQNI